MQTSSGSGLRIVSYEPGNRPDEFWQLAGPVFGSAQAQRELGGPFTDDDRTTWILALDGEALAGLASVRLENGVALLDHAYVKPEYRGQRIHPQLLQARIRAAVGGGERVSRFRVHANPNSLTALLKLGFIANGKRGKYVVLDADAVILGARADAPRLLN